MPCIKCSTNKWKIGNGRCIYTSLQDCERALKAYYANEKKENECFSKNNKSRIFLFTFVTN
jgi:hypothetical protein